MELKLEHMPEQNIVYYRRTGAYGLENIQTMERIKGWAGARLEVPGAAVLGIAWDDGSAPPEQCRYDACFVTEDIPQGPDAPARGSLPGGRYAVFTVPHTPEGVAGAWMGLAAALAEAGLVPDESRPCFERYRREQDLAGCCELCAPVG